MNSLGDDRVYFRSMATRGGQGALPDALPDVIAALVASTSRARDGGP